MWKALTGLYQWIVVQARALLRIDLSGVLGKLVIGEVRRKHIAAAVRGATRQPHVADAMAVDAVFGGEQGFVA